MFILTIYLFSWFIGYAIADAFITKLDNEKDKIKRIIKEVLNETD